MNSGRWRLPPKEFGVAGEGRYGSFPERLTVVHVRLFAEMRYAERRGAICASGALRPIVRACKTPGWLRCHIGKMDCGDLFRLISSCL